MHASWPLTSDMPTCRRSAAMHTSPTTNYMTPPGSSPSRRTNLLARSGAELRRELPLEPHGHALCQGGLLGRAPVLDRLRAQPRDLRPDALLAEPGLDREQRTVRPVLKV